MRNYINRVNIDSNRGLFSILSGFQHLMSEYSLSFQAVFLYFAISYIYESTNDRVRVSAAARLTGYCSSYAYVLLQRLLDKGLIIRIRGRYITTEKGRQFYQAFKLKRSWTERKALTNAPKWKKPSKKDTKYLTKPNKNVNPYFKNGRVPWNKGKKMISGRPEKGKTNIFI